MTRLIPLLSLAFGSLCYAQSAEQNAAAIAANADAIQANAGNIETNAGNIQANADNIQVNAFDIAYGLENAAALIDATGTALGERIDLNATNIDAIGDVLSSEILVNTGDIQTNAGNIEANANAIAAIAADAARSDAPYEWLPHQIPPAFIVDGGWIEVHWICADTVLQDCDLGMVGDGGNVIVLQNFVVPMFVGGRQADTSVNSSVLSISALDPESYWLGSSGDGIPPPKHLWLMNSSGWVHVF